MGVTRVSRALRAYPAPTWLTWVLLIGLAAVYAGERIVPTLTVARAVLSGAGVLLVFAAVVWRLVSWRRAPADGRATERLFFLMYAGCLASLLLFGLAALTGGAGVGADEPEVADRIATAASVAGVIVLALSLLATLAAQWAVGPARDGEHPAGAVDRLRITQLAAAGLVVAMAGATLMLAGYVASQHDKTLDLSYFRTASPGTGVQQIVESMGELRVVLFFPPANEVKDQVLAYFRALGTDNVRIEEHDRLVSPQLAEEYNVTQDGTIVMVAGERTERMALPLELREARRRLRALDGEVRQRLMRVARDQRTVYLTVGHGELNDPRSANPLEDEADSPLRSIRALRSLFGQLNYRVQDIGVQSGLGNDIPDDAAMVLVLGPRRPFLEPELESLHRYLDRGGSLLLALEPGSGFELGPLRERLGVEFHDVPLADDQQHMQQRGNPSDHQLIVTNRFTSHAALSTVSGAGMNAGILFVGAGYLEPFGESSPATFVVRSLPSTFTDVGRDFQFEEGTDERGTFSLVAAIAEDDDDDGEAEDGPQQPGMRAVVLADAELFSDAVVSALGMNAALAADAITWLGREEELSGETTSEEDVPIVHTQAEDAAWFYSTILGAPLLVLLVGVVGVRRRRRRGGRASPVAEGELS